MDTLNDLIEFRNIQSKTLDTRLQIIKEATIKNHGSYADIKSDELLPLQSESDVVLLNKIIDTKDFVIIPVYDNESSITHAYTVGLWYYWGLPEILFDFKEPVKHNQNFLHIFINIIKLELYKKYHNQIVLDNSSINRDIFSYDTLSDEIILNISNYNVDYILKKMDDIDYLNKHIIYMFWFYMYYMDMGNTKGDDPTLYPLYKINVDETNYTAIEKQIYTSILESSTNGLNELELESDLSSIESEPEKEENNVSEL